MTSTLSVVQTPGVETTVTSVGVAPNASVNSVPPSAPEIPAYPPEGRCSPEDARKQGIKTVVPIRFLDAPGYQDKEVVTRLSNRSGSELTSDAALNIYLDSRYIADKLRQDAEERKKAGQPARAVNPAQLGYGANQIARHYEVSLAAVRKWVSFYEKHPPRTGQAVVRKTMRGRPKHDKANAT